MVILDEIHGVSLVSGGRTQKLAHANLCGDVDTLESLKSMSLRSLHAATPNLDRESAESAFDAAFAACEARPGNASEGRAAFDGGEIVISRSLAG